MIWKFEEFYFFLVFPIDSCSKFQMSMVLLASEKATQLSLRMNYNAKSQTWLEAAVCDGPGGKTRLIDKKPLYNLWRRRRLYKLFSPTSRFAMLVLRDQEIGEFYVARESRTMGFEAPKLWKSPSGAHFPLLKMHFKTA